MLTSYVVKCPYLGCDWSGSLLPDGARDVWRGAAPATSHLVFHCPKCQGIWHGHLRDDNLEIEAPDLTPVPWA